MLMLLLCRVLPGGGASPVLAELSTSASLKESTVSKSAGRALSHDACTDIPLVQGWQVVSFQCSGEAPNGFDMLSSVSFGQNDIIMTRDGTVVFATYDGAAWQGQLKATGLSYARGYKVLFSGPAVSVITQSGEPQLPVEDVVLSGGWNWIGHAPLENYEINSGIEVVSGQLSVDDRIKTRSGNTLSQSTFDGTEFQGPLSKLKPGVGYEFYVAQLVTFRYSTGEAGRPLPPPPSPPSPPPPSPPPSPDPPEPSPPPPSPPPLPLGAGECPTWGNTCHLRNNGKCDDGGPGSTTSECAFGTVCAGSNLRPSLTSAPQNPNPRCIPTSTTKPETAS